MLHVISLLSYCGFISGLRSLNGGHCSIAKLGVIPISQTTWIVSVA
jgi:hypothetical protein